jgi:hypothetical protein
MQVDEFHAPGEIGYRLCDSFLQRGSSLFADSPEVQRADVSLQHGREPRLCPGPRFCGAGFHLGGRHFCTATAKKEPSGKHHEPSLGFTGNCFGRTAGFGDRATAILSAGFAPNSKSMVRSQEDIDGALDRYRSKRGGKPP